MADRATLEVIREELADIDGAVLDHVELALDDGAVVLRGAVPTGEQAEAAAMVAERHADEVRNLLRVDPGLREDATNPGDIAADAAERAADGGLPGEMEAQGRPRMEGWSAQATELSDTTMGGIDGDLTSDIGEALGENVPWDPPDHPQAPA